MHNLQEIELQVVMFSTHFKYRGVFSEEATTGWMKRGGTGTMRTGDRHVLTSAVTSPVQFKRSA